MSRHGEDSDEELYMSDPSDDEEAKSVDDFENVDDRGAEGGYQDAAAIQAGFSEDAAAAMHAAEEERARQAEQPAAKEPVTVSKGLAEALTGSRLSAAAPPWTPTRTQSSGASQGSPGAAQNSGVPKAVPTGSSNDTQASNAGSAAADASPASEDTREPEPTTPEKLTSSEEFPGGSPIDVRGMLQRAAAQHEGEASTAPPSVKNGAKEAPAGEGFATTSVAAVRTALEAPKDVESLGLGKAPSSQPSGGGLDLPSRQEPKAVEKETSAGEEQPATGTASSGLSDRTASETPKDIEVLGTKSAPAATEDPSTEPAAASVVPGSNGRSGDDASARTASEAPKDVEALAVSEPVASEERPAAAASGGEAAGSSEGNKKEPARASAMPMLPERKRVGSANPALPPRPNRPRPAQPAEAMPPQKARDVAPSTPANTEQLAQPPPASPAASAERQAGADDAQEVERINPAPAPANGQRGVVVVNQIGAAAVPLTGNPPAAQAQTEEPPETRKLRGDLRDVRIALVRTALRLGMLGDRLVSQVQYRLNLAERIRLPRGTGQDAEDASQPARRAEELDPEEEIFSATIMVIGMAGVGKSATINSLLGYDATPESAFGDGTSGVRQVSGVVSGLRLRFIDTPGLEASAAREGHNRRVLSQVDKARKKYKPDLVIYVDRLDMPRRDLSDIPLLRTVTQVLGSELWFNCILVLTHATGEPPLNPSTDTPLSFEAFSGARTAQMQRAIQAAVGDARIAAPVVCVENSPDCPRNADGDAVLPNEVAWRKYLLMWLASMKLLSDTDSLLDRNGPARGGTVTQQQRLIQQMFAQQRGQKIPPPAFLVQQMIRHQGPKQYPDEEREIKRDDEIRAMKDPVERRAEARKRRDYLKAKQAERRIIALEEGAEGPGPGVAAPELPLNPSFDAENTGHLYHQIETHGGWLTRPKVEPTPVEHTDGVDSFATEKPFVLRKKEQVLDGVPAFMSASIQKDKEQFAIQADAGASLYHSWRLVSTGNLQVLSLGGPDLLYTTSAETQFKGPVFNKATFGGVVSRIGEDGSLPTKGSIATGLKLEDEITLPDIPAISGKSFITAGIGRAQVKLPGNRREKALGANVELNLTAGEKENTQVIAGASMMEYRGNKGVQGNLSTSFFASQDTQVVSKATLQLKGQQKGQGTFSVRVSSHDHSQLGVALLVPLFTVVWDRFRRKEDNIY